MAKLKKDIPSFEVYEFEDLTPEEKARRLKELAKHLVYENIELPTVPIELRSSGEAARDEDERVLARLEQNSIARSTSYNLARNSNVCN